MKLLTSTKALLLLSMGTLTACGGGGGDLAQSSAPQSPGGFATSGDSVDRGTSFFGTQFSFARYDAGEVSEFEQKTVDVEISDDGNSIQLTLDGQSYDLDYNSNSQNYEIVGSDAQGFLRRILRRSDVVDGSYLYIENSEDDRSFGYVTYGFNTDPADVAAQSGNSSYSGFVDLAFDGKERFDFADGQLLMSVDFGSSRISGTFIVSDRNSSGGLVIPTGTLSLQETAIAGNSFQGTLSGSLEGGSFTGTSLGPSSFSGQFFGAEAEAVAGDLNAVFVDGSGAPSISMVGAFVGDERSDTP